MSRIRAVVLALIAIAGMPARGQEPQTPRGPEAFRLGDLGTVPLVWSKIYLIRRPQIQDELKLTNAQRDNSIPQQVVDQFRMKFEAAQTIADPAKREAVLDGYRSEYQSAVLDGQLQPTQRARLDQIHLQLAGLEAFGEPDFQISEFQKAIGLSAAQREKVRAIVVDTRTRIRKAAEVPLPAGLKLEDNAESLRAARKQLETPEFRTAAAKARRDVRTEWDAATERIRDVLTEQQRTFYDEKLGAPFDRAKLQAPDEDVDGALRFLTVRAGLGGQRADVSFNAKVSHPAYTTTHPRVIIDEAHFNFHTASGRYKPFADLVANDGYAVVPGRQQFSRASLKDVAVLVIANALGAEEMGDPSAAKPAFTDEECDAVRDWVKEGGSLLLISDHPPMGSAAADLAQRFGVMMSQGVTRDPKNSGDAPAQLIFSRANKLLEDHAITRGRDHSERLERVMTFTGQSLIGPSGSVTFLKLGDTAADQIKGQSVSVAGHAQGLALTFGKGRVVVLGEAGELSAQVVGPTRRPMGMNRTGIDNRQMALNIMHWLSGLTE